LAGSSWQAGISWQQRGMELLDRGHSWQQGGVELLGVSSAAA